MTYKKLNTARPISPDELIKKKDFVSGIWRNAFKKADEIKASDLHIDQFDGTILIRARIDGELTVINEIKDDAETLFGLINRLKTICSFDLSICDIRQDRSMTLRTFNSRYRIALCPGVFGENFVFRIIRDSELPSLKKSNLSPQAEHDLRWALNRKQGLICITGPTGSGKSTTLQAAIMELDRDKKKIMTVEDPVERYLPLVTQYPITPKLSWTEAIKSAMRQDPDVILIGEIRCSESAALALEAAQTGHLVLSTLHTNDVSGIVDRLIDLGVDRRIIADNLLFISAQRLVQTICQDCKVQNISGTWSRGTGCKTCATSSLKGVIGRTPIVEYALLPSAEMVINFNKKMFQETQLKTNLLGECQKLINTGLIDAKEIENWKDNNSEDQPPLKLAA